MKIIDPNIQVEEYNPIKIMKNIERACRTCYRSEGLITDESYKSLIKNCINRGHESVLEHEKITIRMTCDIGVYKDLTRHRAGTAFSIESTRWCNYGKDKFDNEIKFIKPIFYKESWELANYEGSTMDEDEYKSYLWYDCMEDIENKYMAMSSAGCKPDELRMILPHSTAAQVTMTCNIREWRHILSLRCSSMAHPAIRQLLIPLLLKFKEDMPELFNDIEYDNNFPIEKYATLSVMND
jgi:thymidylate synthase (FAD)